MKFTIEVEDFWIEDGDLSTALTAHIKRSVIVDITKSIEDKVEKAVSEKVSARIDEKLDAVIDNTVSDMLEAGMITINRQPISIVQHIKNMFEKGHGWNDPRRQMEAIAKKFGAELKAQYNNIFAAQIVENMREQGMLKDDVAKLLLNKKPD